MCSDRDWRCKACGERWTSDFHQIVCVSCGNERVTPDEHELIRPRRRQNICLGDVMLSNTTRPDTTPTTVTR